MSDEAGPHACPECGAILQPGSNCAELLQRITAWESADPAARGSLHHLLVIGWQLQHPDRFPAKSLDWAYQAVQRTIAEGLTAEQLRAQTSDDFVSSERVWKSEDGGPAQRMTWQVTLADVASEGPDALPGSILRWAAAVVEDLAVD